MHLYRFQFTPLSPVKGAVDTNTLFGAICWGVRLLKGNRFLEEEFLPAFTQSRQPPFLMSSPLPHGKDENQNEVILFPRPLLPGSILDTGKDALPKRELIRSYPHHKRFKKISHLPWEIFEKILKGEIRNERELFEAIAKDSSSECVNWDLPKPKVRTHSFAKASINRITSTTLGATLYNESATFRGPFSVLFLFTPSGEEKYRDLVEEALKAVELGGNKTVGWGKVALKSFSAENDGLLKEEAYKAITERATKPTEEKTFIALSSFAALDENNRLVIEPQESCYEHRIFRSAIDYAYAFYDERFIKTAVWKKAVLHITAGSLVKLSPKVQISETTLPLIGAVKKVYPDEELLSEEELKNAPRIYQYGLAFPLFVEMGCSDSSGGEEDEESPC